MTIQQYIYQDARMGYYPFFSKGRFLDWLLKTEQYYLRKYIKDLRSEEYYTSVKPNKLLRYWHFRKKNQLGAKLGFFIPAGCFGPDIQIAHYGSIIVNPHSRIGKGCTLHGNCCIGNKGGEPNEKDSPVIGNYVNIGQGAQILGHIIIADHVTIGAGAIVTKSCLKEGATLVGIPAREIE